MSIKKTFTPSALAAVAALVPVLLLSACATAPKQPSSTDTTEPAAGAESNEPDLVAQLRERMAAGSLQRQEKAEDRKPAAATADTSRSPTLTVDAGKQQAAMSVAGDYAKALGLMSADKDDEALALLQKVGKKTPQFSGPWVNQAIILLKQQKFADADKALQEALKVNPNNPFAFNLMGIALRGEGKFADARAAYDSALAIDPNYAKAHFNYGVLADLYMQDLPLALSHYERYQSLQSKPDPAVANWIIDLQKRTGVYKAPAPTPMAPPPPEEDSTETPAASAETPAAEATPAAPADAAAPAAPASTEAAPAAAPAKPAANTKRKKKS
ncbi:MAG: tetratricopeptide repeat protein [bacterium]|nr:tetratricopeptide repeat protein [bacterium]